MSSYQDMTKDQQQAELIIRRWIHKKTGTSDLERGMWKLGEEMRRIGEAARKTFAPILDFIEKGTK